jgi:hypothetical protein
MSRYGGYAVPVAIHCGILRTLLQVGGDHDGELVGHGDGSGGQGLELNVLTRASSGGNESVVAVCVAHVG